MKRTITLGALAMLLIAGCASTGNVEKAAEQSGKVAKTSGDVAEYNTRIRNWSNRTLGEEARPKWLLPATRGDFSQFIAANGLDGDKSEYRLAVYDAGAADVRGAQMRVEMAYARNIARELQQSINSWAAQSANSGAIDAKTRDAISERTQTQSSAEITGHRQVYQFWQKVENLETKETHTLIYQIYHVNPQAWAKTTAKYIKDVVGGAQEVTLEQSQVNDMLSAMMSDARHPIELTQEQQKQVLERSKKMLELEVKAQEKDIDLKDEKLESERQLALVSVAQQGSTERAKIKADAKTAQVKSVADARAMAYASGDPVARQVASVTPADKEWLDAMSLAQSILDN